MGYTKIRFPSHHYSLNKVGTKQAERGALYNGNDNLSVTSTITCIVYAVMVLGWVKKFQRIKFREAV